MINVYWMELALCYHYPYLVSNSHTVMSQLGYRNSSFIISLLINDPVWSIPVADIMKDGEQHKVTHHCYEAVNIGPCWHQQYKYIGRKFSWCRHQVHMTSYPYNTMSITVYLYIIIAHLFSIVFPWHLSSIVVPFW